MDTRIFIIVGAISLSLVLGPVSATSDTSVAPAPTVESSVSRAAPPAVPQNHCVEEKDPLGQRLKPCWEHPVDVQVLFHVYDEVRTTIFTDFTEGGKKPEAVPVEFLSTADPHVPGSIWTNDTGNGTWQKITYLNSSGGATTGKFHRWPDPQTGYTNLTKYTFSITVHFTAKVEHRDGTNQTISETQGLPSVEVPNDLTTDDCKSRPNPADPDDCATKFGWVFNFYYNHSILDFPSVEAVDANYFPTMMVGLVGFTAPSAILAGRHFIRKREVEEEKRREKESRFKV